MLGGVKLIQVGGGTAGAVDVAEFLSGSGAPDSGDGDNGDFWLDTDTTTLWGPKVDGSWVGTDVSLVGPEGEPGPGQNFLESVANAAALPAVGNTVNDFRVTEDDGHAHRWDGAAWIDVGQYRGSTGATGAQGDPGLGLPAGGTTGQVLRKASATDHDTEWTEAIELDALTELAETPADGDMLPVLDVSDTSGGTLPNGTTKKVSKANLVAGLGGGGGGAEIIADALAEVRFDATAAQQTYASETIPGGTCGIGDVIELVVLFEYLQSSGVSANFTPEVTVGGTTLTGFAQSFTNNAEWGALIAVVTIHFVAEDVDKQIIGVRITGTNPQTTDLDGVAAGRSWAGVKTAANDPAVDITVTVKMTMSQSHGNAEIVAHSAFVRHTPKAA